MGEAIIMFVCAVVSTIGMWLLPTADEGSPRRIGIWCVGGLAAATAMQIVAWIGRTGHGVNVLVFVGTIAALTAFSVAVVWTIRNRPAFDDRTQQPTTTYAAQTIQMKRRRF